MIAIGEVKTKGGRGGLHQWSGLRILVFIEGAMFTIPFMHSKKNIMNDK